MNISDLGPEDGGIAHVTVHRDIHQDAFLNDSAALPRRCGPRPTTTPINPQMQLDQQPASLLNGRLLRVFSDMLGVHLDASNRAPEGTIGLFLSAEDANGPPEAFLLGSEFAHLHPAPDGSLHLTLPEPVRYNAITAGWAQPHPLAGAATVSPNTVLVYAPRDETELAIITYLVAAAFQFARGTNPKKETH